MVAVATYLPVLTVVFFRTRESLHAAYKVRRNSNWPSRAGVDLV